MIHLSQFAWTNNQNPVRESFTIFESLLIPVLPLRFAEGDTDSDNDVLPAIDPRVLDVVLDVVVLLLFLVAAAAISFAGVRVDALHTSQRHHVTLGSPLPKVFQISVSPQYIADYSIELGIED